METIAPGTEAWKSMGPGGVVMVDMPGYGKGSREKWGQEIVKYLRGRKQYVLSFQFYTLSSLRVPFFPLCQAWLHR